MRRRLLNFLTAVSLLLYLAASVLWARSHLVTDAVRRNNYRILVRPGGTTTAEQYFEGQSGDGILCVSVFRNRTDHPASDRDVEEGRRRSPGFYGNGKTTWTWRRVGPATVIGPLSMAPGFPGLGYRTSSNRGGLQRSWVVFVPWPLIAAAFAVLPVIWFVRYRRAGRRRRMNACVNCGYDLRGTPDRCPECGHVPSPVGKLSHGG